MGTTIISTMTHDVMTLGISTLSITTLSITTLTTTFDMPMKYFTLSITMEQHIFSIFIEYRGRHRKGVANYYATKVNLWQKTWVS
jgi:hypothetical protein